MTSPSSPRSSESAKLRLKLWRERLAELLRDLEAFLPASTPNSMDSLGVPDSTSSPSDSRAA